MLDPVIEGDAAYNVMGDWAVAYFETEKGLTFGEGTTWPLAPGTDGVFNFLSYSFTLPVDAPHRDAAIEWLKLAGSQEWPRHVQPDQGLDPARTDPDESLYTGYLEQPLADWSDEEHHDRRVARPRGVYDNAWKAEIDLPPR